MARENRRLKLFLVLVGIASVFGCGAACLRLDLTRPGAPDGFGTALDVGDRLELRVGSGRTLALDLRRELPARDGRRSFLAETAGYDGVLNATVVQTVRELVATVRDYRRRRVWQIAVTPEGATVREIDPNAVRPAPGPHRRLDRRTGTGGASRTLASARGLQQGPLAWSRGETRTNVIDILVAYDASALDYLKFNRRGSVETFAENAIQQLNACLANTGLDADFTFALAGTVGLAGDYSQADFSRLLDQLTGGGSADARKVRAAREEADADIVTCFVWNHVEEFGGLAGLGYSLDPDQVAWLADFSDVAYNICGIGAVDNWYTLAHEIGHNMGAGHPRELHPAYGPGPQLFPYSAGFYFTAGGESYTTIMGYSGNGLDDAYYTEVPYFSSPRHTYEGETIGSARADNTRTLRETFAAVSNYRVSRRTVEVMATEGGSVSGAGRYATGRTASLKATPATGFVFAGWYADAGFSTPLSGTADYRTAAFPLTVTDDAKVYARFVAKAEDAAYPISIACEPEADGYLAGTAMEPLAIAVNSLSLPTVTAKGLPAGVKLDAKGLRLAGAPTMPGLYDVTLTAKNLAKATTNAVVRIRVRNFTDAEIYPELADAYGPFIPGVPVELDLSGAVTNASAVSGLPAGLKWNKAACRVTGVPTKPGNSTVLFKLVRKEPNAQGRLVSVTHQASATFAVDALRGVKVVMIGDGTGKVTGAGAFAANKKITLKATADAKDAPAKGKSAATVKSAFAGWYRDAAGTEPVDVAGGDYRAASLPVTVTAAPETTFYARFVPVAADRASIATVIETEGLGPLPEEGTVETSVPCGVALRWPVAAEALSLPTVRVSGLPAGLKFTAKDVMRKGSKTEVEIPANTIYGAPTAGSKYDAKAGSYVPSKVKVTTTTTGKSSVSYTVLLTVTPLPDWAQGTFAGGGVGGGLAALTVAKTGKLTGKWLAEGLTWTLAADAFAAFDGEAQTYFATLVGKSGKQAFTNDLTLAGGAFGGVATATDLFTAGQNIWKRAPWKALAASFGRAAPVTVAVAGEQPGEIAFKFAASGAVTATGAFVTGVNAKGLDVIAKATCASTLLPCTAPGADGSFEAEVAVYFPPKGAFAGFSRTYRFRWDGTQAAFFMV